MSLYSTYNLQPPPPPTAFTRHAPADRAMLPALLALYPNDPAAQARGIRDWSEQLFFWDFSIAPGFFTQLKVSAALICALIALVVVIIARRMKERSFWIIRFAQKRNGTIVIPNAISCFTLMEGIYGVMIVALCFELVNFFEDKKPPQRVVLWLLLPWVSLIWGAAYSCWGALLAAPENRSDGKKEWFSLRSVVRYPLLANLICLMLPLVQSISVLIPAILSNVYWQRALDGYLSWRAQYATADALSRDMLLEVQGFQTALLRSIYYVSVTYTLWTLWASLFFLIYARIVYGLFLDILRHVRLLNSQPAAAKRHSKRRPARSSWMPWKRFSGGEGSRASTEKRSSSTDESPERSPVSNKRALIVPEDFALGGVSAAQAEAIARGEALGSPSTASRALSPRSARFVDTSGSPAVDDTNTMHIFSRQEVAEDRPNASFFPAVKPSKVIVNSPTAFVGNSTRDEHARMFRRLLVNFGVQFVAINLAVLVYTGIALYCAVELYSSAEANNIGKVAAIGVLSAMWAAVVFGSITLVAIALRTYEGGQPAGAVSDPTGATPKMNGGAWRVVSNITERRLSTTAPGLDEEALGGAGRRPSDGFKFTRATKKATQLADNQSVPVSLEGNRSISRHSAGQSGQDHSEIDFDMVDASGLSDRIVAPIGGARRPSATTTLDESIADHTSASASVAHIDHFAYPKPVPGQKILTPADFHTRDRRHGHEGGGTLRSSPSLPAISPAAQMRLAASNGSQMTRTLSDRRADRRWPPLAGSHLASGAHTSSDASRSVEFVGVAPSGRRGSAGV